MPLNYSFFLLRPEEHPGSLEFKPVSDRTPIEQARWWALISKRLDRQERALYSRDEEDRLPEVSFDLWRLLKESGSG